MIVVNARFLTQPLTGVQRFAIEISLQLKHIYGNDIVFVSPHNILYKDIASELNVLIIGKHTGHLWEQSELPKFLKSKGNPLLLCLCNTAPLFYTNLVATLHDITFKRYPNTFSWKFRIVYNILIPQVVKSSKHIFSVSDFSINEISKFYGYPKDKMSLIYNAVDESFHHVSDNKLSESDYLFTVSSVKENKNFLVTLEAFVKASSKIKNLKLYIAGDLKSQSFNKMNLSKYKDIPDIYFLGRISDADLIRYYSNARAFIFPSLYEGFGIPVLEAQACGCPVISSNSSSLPEILGESAIMCSPTSADEFAQAIIRLYEDKTLGSELIRKGMDNVKRFLWKDSAMKIKEVLDRINY